MILSQSTTVLRENKQALRSKQHTHSEALTGMCIHIIASKCQTKYRQAEYLEKFVGTLLCIMASPDLTTAPFCFPILYGRFSSFSSNQASAQADFLDCLRTSESGSVAFSMTCWVKICMSHVSCIAMSQMWSVLSQNIITKDVDSIDSPNGEA